MNNFIWNKESENSIYNAVDDWGYHKFACLMKDGTIEEFHGMWDENCEGERFLHIDHVLDARDVEDIVMWIEVPNIEEK